MNKPSEYNDPFEFAEFIDFSRLQGRLNDNAGFDIVAYFAENYAVPEEVKQAAAMAPDPKEKLIDYALKNEGRNDLEIEIFKTAMREFVKSEYEKALQ